MANWLTFATTLSLWAFLIPTLGQCSNFTAPYRPSTSGPIPRFAQPKDIGQFVSSYEWQGFSFFSLLCLYGFLEKFFFSCFWAWVYMPQISTFFNPAFLCVKRGKKDPIQFTVLAESSHITFSTLVQIILRNHRVDPRTNVNQGFLSVCLSHQNKIGRLFLYRTTIKSEDILLKVTAVW